MSIVTGGGGGNGTIFPGKSDTTFRWFLMCISFFFLCEKSMKFMAILKIGNVLRVVSFLFWERGEKKETSPQYTHTQPIWDIEENFLTSSMSNLWQKKRGIFSDTPDTLYSTIWGERECLYRISPSRKCVFLVALNSTACPKSTVKSYSFCFLPGRGLLKP